MIKKQTLDNGLRIVMEKIDYVKSASIGIWVNVGSYNENDETNGLSHFIEHMLFKGTINRKANEIAEEIDSLGAQMNAFTSKECTSFYVTSPSMPGIRSPSSGPTTGPRRCSSRSSAARWRVTAAATPGG